MNHVPPTSDLSHIMKSAGISDDADWMAIVLFVRNLLTRLTVYTDEKKAEIQREICAQLAKKDFSDQQYEAIIAMLDMYIMQNIGSLELEEALSQEKRSGAELLNEMQEMIAAMQGSNSRQQDNLNSFKDETVGVIRDGTRKSVIVAKVRGMFQELIAEFKEEARELNNKARQLEQSAYFDPLLTELHNRRALDAHLQKTVNDLKDTPGPLSLMIIDVDNFKNVNDTYGHQAGDDVLRALARIITAHATQYSGFSARYGGEELVIVMKDMTLDTAAIKAEAVRADVERYDFRVRTDGKLSDESLQFTVSIGVSAWQKGWETSDLIRSADTALYAAKDSGRNTVCIAD